MAVLTEILADKLVSYQKDDEEYKSLYNILTAKLGKGLRIVLKGTDNLFYVVKTLDNYINGYIGFNGLLAAHKQGELKKYGIYRGGISNIYESTSSDDVILTELYKLLPPKTKIIYDEYGFTEIVPNVGGRRRRKHTLRKHKRRRTRTRK